MKKTAKEKAESKKAAKPANSVMVSDVVKVTRTVNPNDYAFLWKHLVDGKGRLKEKK